MTNYEAPQIIVSYSIDELVEEAAVCVIGYGNSQ